jgi:cell division protein FtsA
MTYMRKSRSPRTIAAVDIGTSKIVCLIVAAGDYDPPVLLGIGHQRSRGLKAGIVTDVDEAAGALRPALAQAERMAGTTPDRVVMSVSCGRIRALRFMARAAVTGPVVRQDDIDRVMAGGEAWIERSGRALVDIAQADWRLDGQGGIADPRGLAGRDLAVELSAVTADEGPPRNLVAVAERCHLGVNRLIAAPIASAIAVTTEEERRIGTLVVDIGAGVTTLCQLENGRPILVEVLPFGGNHVTFDLARGLVTSVAEAERIKTLYGTLVKAASNESELLSYPVVGEAEPEFAETSRAHVANLVRPRIEQLLDLVGERLAEAGVLQSGASATGGVGLRSQPARVCVGSVVLTGGATQLSGLDGVWVERFGGTARIGRPRPLGRMTAAMCSPAFAAAIGLVLADRWAVPSASIGARRDEAGYLGRVQQWFRESF